MADRRTDDLSAGTLTPYRGLDDTLAAYASAARTALGVDLVGLYLLGSLAVGDFDLTSDVDFLIVTRRELDPDQLKRLASAHTQILARDTRWVEHLEYSVFPLPILARASSPYGRDGRHDTAERQLWYVGNGSPAPVRSDHDNTVVTRWVLRHRSPAVVGPPAATFAPEVTAHQLRREIRSSVIGWEPLFRPGSEFDNRFHQVFFVLNQCRSLQGLHEGRITSKRDGVAWARDHLDARWHPLIDYSWREREDTTISVTQPADPDAVEETVAFLAATTRLAQALVVPDD